MTSFFATPDETMAWVAAEVDLLRLVVRDEVLPGGSRRCFLWPPDVEPLPAAAYGVMVWFPEVFESTLTMGVTGWKATAFGEPVASIGRGLSRRLTRSLRKFATVPLYAVSGDRASRGNRPSAWGTRLALSEGHVLRQFRDGLVTFEP